MLNLYDIISFLLFIFYAPFLCLYICKITYTHTHITYIYIYTLSNEERDKFWGKQLFQYAKRYIYYMFSYILNAKNEEVQYGIFSINKHTNQFFHNFPTKQTQEFVFSCIIFLLTKHIEKVNFLFLYCTSLFSKHTLAHDFPVKQSEHYNFQPKVNYGKQKKVLNPVE